MKFHIIVLAVIIVLINSSLNTQAQVNTLAQAQIDSVIAQLTDSPVESFAGGISGDGRLVVFESTGNLATENPRNSDGNREIFIFDYAQRRIFQITNTVSLRNDTTQGFTQANTRVSIANIRPVISNNGRWIAFGSNATTATPTTPTNTTNPGNFQAESFNPVAPATTPENPLLADGNTEMWLYQIPQVTTVDLSAGDEIAFTDLSAGTFTRVTNTLPSRLPFAGSATLPPVIGDDNRDASISDDGNYIAFVSNRDLVPTVGNEPPIGNDEIFTYVRTTGVTNQITQTARGTIVAPIYNQNPTISGNGLRIAFLSNADNPIVGMSGGTNNDRNVEIFFADLASSGATTATTIKRQVTSTTRVNPGDLVNILDYGRRMSRDGRYIAFDSYADLTQENNGANYASYATYVFDANVIAPANPFRRIGPRSDADSAATGGDVPRYPGFTDYDAASAPATLVFETRANINETGGIVSGNDSGLNPNAARPAQIYAYPLNVPATTATFKRLTNFPTPNTFIASTQPIPSNSVRRMTFNLGLTEVGTGNADLQSEAYYFLLPTAVSQSTASLNLFTGASRQVVSASPVPTPSPTATPTPSPSPSPSVTPTPQTPAAVQGVSPGMLVTIDYNTGSNNVVVARTAVGSLERRFTLPIELSGVSLSINGAAAGIKSVTPQQITFVVPPGLSAATAGTTYPIVVNSSGVVFRGTVTLVQARPDVFTSTLVPAPGGRARIFNATNTVLRTEPFSVTTIKIKGGRRVPTVLRVFLTGVNNIPAGNISVRIRDVTLTGASILTGGVLREPGIYSVDFTLPETLLGAGNVPIVVSVTINGVTYNSRLDDTAPFFRIL